MTHSRGSTWLHIDPIDGVRMTRMTCRRSTPKGKAPTTQLAAGQVTYIMQRMHPMDPIMHAIWIPITHPCVIPIT